MLPSRRSVPGWGNRAAGPTGIPDTALEAFREALRREQHVLLSRPGLLWQQLHNRLQWAEEPVPSLLAREYRRRTAPGSRAWLRTLSPVRESAALVRTLNAHDARITCCAFSPDGCFLVSSSQQDQAALKVWDTGTGQERCTLAGHVGPVRACAVSPDGQYIVSAGSDGTLRLWDPVAGACLRTLRGHTDDVSGCAVSPDGSYIVSVGRDETLRLWDPETGAERASLSAPGTSQLTCCAVSADATMVVTGTYRATLELWDVAARAHRATLGEPSFDDIIAACAVSPDGSFIVSCGFENTLQLWDVAAAAQRATLAGHTGRVFDCAVSPDGSYIVSASMDRTLRLWDPQTGQPEATLVSHAWAVTACEVGPDGVSIASGGDDGVLKLWDAQAAREQATLAGHTQAVTGCAFSPDGSFAVSAGTDRTVRIWDTGTGRERVTLAGHLDQVNACAVSPDGTFIVSASSDGTLIVWDTGTGAEQARLGVAQVVFHPYKIDPNLGQDIRAVSEAAFLLRAGAGPESPVAGHTGPVVCCAVSGDGSFIVSGGEDHTVIAWDAGTGQARVVFHGHAGPGWVTACAIAPDSSYIVSAGGDATLRIWDPATGKERATLAGHTGGVTACAIAPDGSYLVSAGEDGTLRLWDPLTGTGRTALTGHDEPVTGCAITPDGAFVVSAGADSTLRLWDTRTSAELAILPLTGRPAGIAVHPSRPLVACGDGGGNLHLVVPEGVESGPAARPAPSRPPAAAEPAPAALVGAVPLGSEAAGEAAQAQTAMSRQDWAAAIRHYGAAIGLAHENEFCLMPSGPAGTRAIRALVLLYGERANAHAHRGDYQKSLEDYQKVLERDPQNAHYLDQRARVYHLTGDYERAVAGYTQALALLPGADQDAPGIYAYRARSNSELGRLDLAQADLAEAARLCRDPGLAAMIEQVQRELFPMKTCDGCGNEFELLRYACPRCGDSSATAPSAQAAGFMWRHQEEASQHVDQGGLLFRQGRYDDAEQEFRTAIETNPWNATAHANIGMVMLRRDRLAEAIRCFERALEIDPRVAGVREMLAAQRAELARRTRAAADRDDGGPTTARR
jgi:WD40 repeat protein/tetratricopeptide (TPR) repeat protein